MRRSVGASFRARVGPWAPSLAFGSATAVVAVEPAALVPLARAVLAVCERLPFISVITRHAPPLLLALVVGLAAVALLAGARAGLVGLVATLRFNREIDGSAAAPPARLVRTGRELGIVGRLTHLAHPGTMAFCYGFLRPRIAVTSGLLAVLDDAELLAVLAHERQHLRRRDPARYLVVDALAAAAFMLPIAAALRDRIEARIELAADRAALAVAPRGALAGALLAVLSSAAPTVPGLAGLAGLSATEARIANLAGQPALPPIPTRAVVVSLVVAALVAAAVVGVALSAQPVTTTCLRCAGA